MSNTNNVRDTSNHRTRSLADKDNSAGLNDGNTLRTSAGMSSRVVLEENSNPSLNMEHEILGKDGKPIYESSPVDLYVK